MSSSVIQLIVLLVVVGLFFLLVRLLLGVGSRK